jgi:4-hydroxybenzoate polyprenyltransferase
MFSPVSASRQDLSLRPDSAYDKDSGSAIPRRATSEQTAPAMRLLPYARLLRIPNVFTALADIALGVCAAIAFRSEPVDGSFLSRAAVLFFASACLYSAGMVWNDYFDIEEDRRDRPYRPLPSGAVSLPRARTLAILLTFFGWVAAANCGPRGLAPGPAAYLATLLVAAILIYDRWLKRTWLGPLGMGLCRFLNVLLGLSLSTYGEMPDTVRFYLALTIGVYITGVTWFARTEAHTSKVHDLRGAALAMLLALLLALAVPTWLPPGTASPLFPYLLVAFGFYLGFPVAAAIDKPTPERVQKAVKRAILGLIALDAILATAFVGTWGLCTLLLLPPALVLGKWVYST